MNSKSHLNVLLVLIAGVAGLVSPSVVCGQARISTQQNRALRKIDSGIDRAGKLFQNNKPKPAAELIIRLAEELHELLKEDPSPVLLSAAQIRHSRLRQARQTLQEAGQKIPAIADLPGPRIDPNAPVSFTAEIAPLLNTHCGACHVRQSRGQLSMASFNGLATGVGGAPVIVPGKPGESRLIEAIEEGAMPPNGTVPDSQVARLKKWVAEGARFDGADPMADIVASSNRPRRASENSRPLGTETISFSRDVAPVLIANCMGCHFEAQNVRGGLRLDNFRQLLRGGDSGLLIREGDGANSLLVQRLTATDNSRMPQRRPPLKRDTIDKIVTWIDEGARFDGRAGGLNLREVSAIATAEAATHEELIETRRGSGLGDWKKVTSDMEPALVEGQAVLVFGSPSNTRLQGISDLCDDLAGEIKSKLRLNDSAPLVKGRVSVFVFDRRYDYSEFGRMIESRDLPKGWRSHWGYDTVNAYVALLNGQGSLTELKPELTLRLAAVAVAALEADVPEWFADGMAYLTAEGLVADRSLIKKWQSRSRDAIAEMGSPTDFMQQRLANDKSGLVAYAFVRTLKESDTRKFQKFLKAVQSGTAFEEAFATAWSAAPIELMRRQFGNSTRPKNPRQPNRRNR